MGCNCSKTPQQREEERRALAEQRRINREKALAAREAQKQAVKK